MNSHLYLVGLRGVGKTTIGQQLAARFGVDFVDVDREIQARDGRTIAQIFSESGEAEFRELEAGTIDRIARVSPTVVALGGGACERQENRDCLKRSGKVVWLTASVDRLWQRISDDPQSTSQRPALSERDGLSELIWLEQRRRANYAACADFTWDTSLRTPAESVIAIATWWENADN